MNYIILKDTNRLLVMIGASLLLLLLGTGNY